MKLPSGYIYSNGLSGSSAYIDTGILTKSTHSAQISFRTSIRNSTAIGYIYGARNTSSTSSVGQSGFYLGALGSADYFCWAGARVSSTMPSVDQNIFNFSHTKNSAVLNANNNYVSEFSGATTSFTGTRTIHLFGLNNAGSHTAPSSSVIIYGFKLWDDDTLVANFIPCYEESSSTAGMYDLVGGNFFSSASGTSFNAGRLIQVTSSTGGKGYVVADGIDNVEKAYKPSGTTPITVIAVPNEGYVFKNWTISGSEVSVDEEYTFTTNSDTTIQANFVKETSLQLDQNYTAIVLPYNEQNGSDSKLNATYLQVRSASISEDAMQRSTSTIVCDSIPSLRINTAIMMLNPKGKVIFYGAIKSIEGNTLTCREPLYLMDYDSMEFTSEYNAHYNALRHMLDMINAPTERSRSLYGEMYKTSQLPVDSNLLANVPMASITDNSVVNDEDRVIALFNEYGVVCRYSWYKRTSGSNVTWRIGLSPFNPKEYGRLIIGNNSEVIKNVNITTTEADATILQIYNSSGSTLRGEYGIKWDGTIGKIESGVNLNDFVYRTFYAKKVVMSDDGLRTIAVQNLSNSLYQHKIEFDLYLDGMITMDDIKIGRPVTFYYNDQVYDSIITGRSYNLENGKINSVHVVMGIARTNLTSLLNLKKVK